MSASTVVTPVLAAGAVCWREGKTGPEILLISRSRHDDVSLPKGKLDPGETLPETAVREIREETGYRVVLGAPLGVSEYVLPGGRDKFVHYWAAEVTKAELTRGRFRPNDEVDHVEWLPVKAAKKRLTYERDGEVLDRFQAMVDNGALRTFALIVLRHGKAEAVAADGSDSSRHLTSRGRRQADDLARIVASWAPTGIASSPARRCQETVGPLGAALAVDIKTKRTLSQDAWEGPSATEPFVKLKNLVARRVERRESSVLCAHSPVLPPLVDAIATVVGGTRDGRLTRAAILSTAEFSVFHISAEHPERGFVAVETHAPLD